MVLCTLQGASERQKEEVQCIPLENLVYAAHLTKPIDLLVLDMSGSDLDVLLNTKLDQIPDIEVSWSMFSNPGTKHTHIHTLPVSH